MSPRASPRARTAAPSRRWWRWTAPSCWRAAGASASRCAAAPPRPPCSPRAWRWGGGRGRRTRRGGALQSLGDDDGRRRCRGGLRRGGDHVNPVPVLSATEAAAWDSAARTQYRIPSRVLMEAAGRAVAQVVLRDFPDVLARGVLVAAGAGNNGGDGWVAARALHAAAVPVWVAALDPKTDDAIDNRALARVDGVREIGREEPWPAAAVAVDALLGTGAAGPARGDVLALAQRLVTYGAPIVAIDGPTGLDLSTGEAHGPLRADVPVTFGGPRRGHLLARDWCGKVVVVDIGFPPPDPGWPVLVTDAWAGARLPKLAPTMHKGDRGRVTVVGGSNGMTGAALHAARAAGRRGGAREARRRAGDHCRRARQPSGRAHGRVRARPRCHGAGRRGARVARRR